MSLFASAEKSGDVYVCDDDSAPKAMAVPDVTVVADVTPLLAVGTPVQSPVKSLTMAPSDACPAALSCCT